MDFQVRKGLETPLKVHGMRTKFFCIYCIILAVIVLFVVGFLTSAMSGEGSFLAFIVSLVAGASPLWSCGSSLSTFPCSASSASSKDRYLSYRIRIC